MNINQVDMSETLLRTLKYASEEAEIMHHMIFGAEHVFMVLDFNPEATADKTLRGFTKISLPTARTFVRPMREPKPTRGKKSRDPLIHFSDELKSALNVAVEIAREGDPRARARTDHFLVAALRTKESTFMSLVAHYGIDPEALENALLAKMSTVTEK